MLLLRASGEVGGREVDLGVVTDPKRAAASGVAHATTLIALADAMAGEDEEALRKARQRVLDEMGSTQLVDGVAVASNFERMVRIADGTGIPLDPPVAALSADLRSDLGLERFASAARTPAVGFVGRVLAVAARPTLRLVLRVLGRLRGVRGRGN